MRRIWMLMLVAAVLALVGPGAAAMAQEVQQQANAGSLTLFTRFPSQMVELGKAVTLDLTLRSPGQARIVQLSTRNVPAGWTASFSGDGRIVQSAYVDADKDATVSLKLEPAENVEPGPYRFTVLAEADGARAELPLELTVQEKLPSRVSFDVDLPTLRGGPTTNFRYNATLRNEGDQELTLSLLADAPQGFQVKFTLSGQEVSSFPIGPNESKTLDIQVTPPPQVAAGSYQIGVAVQGNEVDESLVLTADVTGQPDLAVTTPDERLSREVYAGQASSIKILVRNSGSAAARDVSLSATPPGSWSVTFAPESLPEIPPGGEVEVTANVEPAEQAIAGDYMLSVRAQPKDGTSKSADLRLTVRTSTLWGVVGVALIAVAVGVVGLAVVRFGRR